MRSLSTRLLISVSVLLLLFFGATIFVLDTAFSTAGEQARRHGELDARQQGGGNDDQGEEPRPDGERIGRERGDGADHRCQSRRHGADTQLQQRERQASRSARRDGEASVQLMISGTFS